MKYSEFMNLASCLTAAYMQARFAYRTKSRAIVDALDDHLMTLMELTAKDEITNEFMTTAGGIYYCMRSNRNEYEFADAETRKAFELFRAFKGYN